MSSFQGVLIRGVPLLLYPMEKKVCAEHTNQTADSCFRLVVPHQHCICLAALQWPRLTYHVSLDSNFVLQFSFEVSMNLADLLQCGRLAVGATINAGLRGQLGRLTSAHREFIRALNRFLLSNTSFDI